MSTQTATAFRRIMTGAAIASVLAVSAAASAAAETYTFDPAHTEIRISWSHFGLSRMSARALTFDGTLNLDKAAPEKSTIDVKIDANGLWTHSDKLNEHLKSKDFFDTAAFPSMTFATTKVERTGDKTAKLTGDLTIHGITKPATFDVTLNFDGAHPISKKPTAGFSAKGTIKRSEFGVGKYAPAVSDDIAIEIETEMNAKN